MRKLQGMCWMGLGVGTRMTTLGGFVKMPSYFRISGLRGIPSGTGHGDVARGPWTESASIARLEQKGERRRACDEL